MQSEDTWMELHVLHRHGWSIAALAREFGLDWRTARRYATATTPPRYGPRARPSDLSAAQLAHVERRLAACPDLRVTVLLRELREAYGYTASYASLRRRVVGLRPAPEAEPEVRFAISAYLRWVNMIGWAGLAIGNLQLLAPSDEMVLAAGLAWEGG